MIDKIYGKRIVKNKVTKYQKRKLPDEDKKDLEYKSLTLNIQRSYLNHPEVSIQS